VLGNPHGAAALRRAGKGGASLRAAIARNADRHANDLASPAIARRLLAPSARMSATTGS
jgi:hypothetical protein